VRAGAVSARLKPGASTRDGRARGQRYNARLRSFLKPGCAEADEKAVSTPGQKLRKLRLSRRLSLSEVQQRTERLAKSRRNPRFRVTKSRLCGIEIHGRTPSIYCLYALAIAYDCDLRKLLRFYGCA